MNNRKQLRHSTPETADLKIAQTCALIINH